ncbi:MAG TPA: SAM-dependent chlorinase/fluorinase [Methylomirabilota bacterium]|nr:SAM-dependent chlorinase/fluorinase [Methylomirabilota bacterium]
MTQLGAAGPERRLTTPIVTLTTDFGIRDSYVAEMKGVILGIAPTVQLVDVTHDVEPQQVAEAALAVDAAAPFFPKGTTHLAVVDPDVGSERRGLVVVAAEQCFVGPDNGLFTPILLRGGWVAFELTAPEYRLPAVSRTFHGRDVFAPAAAHLALGVAPSGFGAPVLDPVRLPWPEARPVPGGVAGAVVHIDRFGNLVTSIAAAQVVTPAAGAVRICGSVLPLVGTYADLPPGGAGALIGSRNRLEVVVRDGNAAERFGARRGTPVVFRRTVSLPGAKRPRSRS